jgi:hypothetical protein
MCLNGCFGCCLLEGLEGDDVSKLASEGLNDTGYAWPLLKTQFLTIMSTYFLTYMKIVDIC